MKDPRAGARWREVIEIGGTIGYEGGFLPIKIPGVFPNGLPAIATAAVVGIVLNLVFRALKSHGAVGGVERPAE